MALGLFGRGAAALLFLFNIIAVISYPDLGRAGLEQHSVWGVMLLVSLLHGPGSWSVDAWIKQSFSKPDHSMQEEIMNTYPTKRVMEGQRALVTSADTEIGAVIAEALADAGAKVMINYLNDRDKAELVAERIRAKQGQAMIFRADVSEESQVKSMFDVLIGYWGNVDILVINTSLPKDVALMDMSLDQWHKITCDLTGQFLHARETAREIMQRGVEPELTDSAGKIICIATLPNSYHRLERSICLAKIYRQATTNRASRPSKGSLHASDIV